MEVKDIVKEKVGPTPVTRQKIVAGEPPRVALLLEVNFAWHQFILRGIADYLALHPRWKVYVTSLGDVNPDLADLRKLHLHGLIIGDLYGYPSLEWQRQLRFAGALRVPVVLALSEPKNSGHPEVASDDYAVGKLAAEYFQHQGFQNFAYYGGDMAFSRLRKQGFVETLAGSDQACSVLLRGDIPWGKLHQEWETNPLAAWLKTLRRPAAVMACSDLWARHIVFTCERLGLRIPEDIALLGVDNQTALCEMLSPFLTSIELNPRRIGYLAAAQLSDLMAGATPDTTATLVPPIAVVPRHSTDVVSVDDPDIAEAARFIRENAAMPITVEDVYRKVMISRRKLEVGFKRTFHRTPQKEIWRVRVARAKTLLEQTSAKMPRIAQLSGFSNADRLCVIFRRETGVTPSDWRQRSRSV